MEVVRWIRRKFTTQPEHLYLCNQIDDGKALANRVQLLGGECALNSVTKKR